MRTRIKGSKDNHKQRHICIITSQFPPYSFTGPSTTANHLVNHLSSRGYDVTVVTASFSGNDKSYERTKDVEIYRIRINNTIFRLFPGISDERMPFMLNLRKLRKAFDFTRFDAISTMF